MMINIKAQQTLVKFSKTDAGTLLYVMRPETYSRLAESKVIQEASVRSGIARGALKGAWDAIGEVIKAWVTEGHSVAIPGLGSLRFSMNADAVADVNDVAKSLIRSRKVVYTPSVDIKNELKQLKVAITCYDKDGNEVKRVTDDTTNEEVEDPENTGNGGGTNTGGGASPNPSEGGENNGGTTGGEGGDDNGGDDNGGDDNGGGDGPIGDAE
ncbi:MAG: DNA-binding protein [Bacteroidaceae bacterium]|nr:DNA-binding protein [Bacteroidaceae bacterium]